MSWVGMAAAAAALAQAPAQLPETTPTPAPVTPEVTAPVTEAAPPAAVRRSPVNVTAEAAGDAAVTPYAADFFTSYRPNTALDMVNRLPGFSIEEGDEVRGFAGTAGNVLIDGQRPASKSDSVESQLGRIPASQVERIEVIRGGAPGIDMQGRSLVANIIRRSADTTQHTLIARLEHFSEDGRTLDGLRYDLARKAGPRSLNLTVGRFIGYDDSTGVGRRTRTNAQGVVIRDETVGNEADGHTHQGQGDFKTPLWGGKLTLNGTLARNQFKPESHFDGTAGRLDVVDSDRGWETELGVNYVRDFGAAWSAELIALNTTENAEYRSRSEAYDRPGGLPDNDTLFTSDSDSGERIGRAVIKHKRTPALSFEFGGEIAFNFLEGSTALIVDGRDQSLPFSDVRVEEDRNEIFALANWKPIEALTLEGGARYETSTIRQIGEGARERSFEYLKPRFLATWLPMQGTTVRFRAERVLGQLDFGDFVSTANLTTGVVASGNPDLEPNKTWVYEAAIEKRFWKTGAVTLALRYEDITDVIDRIPVTTRNETTGVLETFEAPGNIGDGTNDTVELDVTLPLERLGLWTAEFKIDALWRRSEVVDPTTGEERRISGQRPDVLEFSYRQEIPDRKLTLTGVWFDGWSETYYNFNQVSRFNLGHYAEVGAEYKPRPSTAILLSLSNIGRFNFDRSREVYTGRRDVSPLDYFEERTNRSQWRAILRLRQSFGG